MKSILSALVATALLGSISLADEIDDQIQRLEKENKLLELQNKKKQLEMNGQIVNQNADSGNNSLTSQNQSKVEKKASLKNKPYSKNGGFLGVEGVLGGANVKLTNTGVLTYSNNSPTSTTEKVLPFDANTTFDMGLVGGYQHYFGSSKRHGIKVSAHLYSGFGNTDEMNYDEESKITLSYIPIKMGLDVKYLYDFFERGKHTLGLNVGLGYEFDAYVGGKEKYTTTLTDNMGNSKTDEDSHKLDNLYTNAIYPVIGLHYYYGHHQFELMYRFGGILGQQVSKDVMHDHSSHTETIDKNDVDVDVDGTSKITILTQSYLTFNYTYRF